MSFGINSLHLHVCGCPACTGESLQSKNGAYIASPKVEAEDITTPTSESGYVRGLLGTNAKLWVSGNAGTESFGNAINLKYFFGASSFANPFGYSGATNFTAGRTAAVTEAMQDVANVCGVTFSAGNASTANISFRSYNLPNGVAGQAAVSAYASGKIASAEVTLTNPPSAYGAATDASAFTKGAYGWMAAKHELLHALGIKHPGNYNAGGGGADAPYFSDLGIADTNDVSIMSYYRGVEASAIRIPTNLMYADILALQKLYGVNGNYNNTDTSYTVANLGVQAIYDAGGTDTFTAAEQTVAATIDLSGEVSAWSRVGNARIQTFGTIENAIGGSAADTLKGNALANTLTGNGGNDTLTGGTGNDTLVGGAGADNYVIAASGDGTDVITDSDGLGSLVFGGVTLAGTATASGSDYVLTVGGATFTLTLSGTTLTIVKSGGTSTLQINNFTSGNFGITLSGVAMGGGGGGGGGGSSSGNINGTTLNDIITGTSAAEVIYGLAGDDKIDTSKTGGIDTIDGGTGNDIIVLGAVGGSVSGGDGNDVISSKAASGTVVLNGDAGADKITGSSIATTFNGGTGNDTIKGGAGNDTMNGDGNDDQIDSGAGSDSINGGDGNDALKGGAGVDVMNGDNGNDSLDGAAGTDTLNGGAGNDYILGGGDADSITGGAGADTINGGAGADIIVLGNDGAADILSFVNAKELTGDVVTGFDKGVDKVQLGGSLRGAVDDLSGAADGIFTFSTGNSVNFTSSHEGWIVSGSATLTDLAAVANVFNAAGSITAGKGADGLLVLNNGGTTGLYQYVEKGSTKVGAANAVNHIDAADLIFLGTIGQNDALTSVDFSLATI